MADGAFALELRAITKSFDGVRALGGASLVVERSSVHGLVGQNGAGKSTLIKILAGLHQPDAGTITVHGATQHGLTPHRVEQLGIQFIHQDRLLVPSFTVGEALLLGHEITYGRLLPFLDRRAMQRRAETILRDYFGMTLPPNALISELTIAQRQIIQITRALLLEPKILVFDEPTAALVQREAAILFGLIRRLREEGITIVYISHYLEEIETLCDRVTVLRDGVDVARVDPAVTPAAAIAALMIERDIKEMFPKRRVPLGEAALEVRGLGIPGKFANVSFTVRRGEIVGLTGLVGSGAKELVRTLFGLESAQGGEFYRSDGRTHLKSPRAAVWHGLAFVPEDRRGQGVAQDLTVRENTTLASLRRFTRKGFLRAAHERRETDGLIRLLQIRTPGRDALVRTLSGGNQQKVVLAKWLSCQSNLYILDEPTVGIDIGTKVEIYALIGDLVEKGAGILLLSSDLPELLGIADRILVMYRGRITREFISAETTAQAVLAEAAGSFEVRHVH